MSFRRPLTFYRRKGNYFTRNALHEKNAVVSGAQWVYFYYNFVNYRRQNRERFRRTNPNPIVSSHKYWTRPGEIKNDRTRCIVMKIARGSTTKCERRKSTARNDNDFRFKYRFRVPPVHSCKLKIENVLRFSRWNLFFFSYSSPSSCLITITSMLGGRLKIILIYSLNEWKNKK